MTPKTTHPVHKLCPVGGAPNARTPVLSIQQVCFLDMPCRHMQLHPHNSATNELVRKYPTCTYGHPQEEKILIVPILKIRRSFNADHSVFNVYFPRNLRIKTRPLCNGVLQNKPYSALLSALVLNTSADCTESPNRGQRSNACFASSTTRGIFLLRSLLPHVYH
jgi:hypothetical protein